MPIGPFRKKPAAPRPLSLALQGGGAHGAFEWGILDRLLEEDDIEIKAVTAASAGAMNAVCLAHGLAEGGAEEVGFVEGFEIGAGEQVGVAGGGSARDDQSRFAGAWSVGQMGFLGAAGHLLLEHESVPCEFGRADAGRGGEGVAGHDR